MASVRDILATKGSQVLSIGPDASTLDAAILMNEHKVGCLVVLDGGAIAGMFSERDLMHGVVVPQRDPAQTAVREVMTSEVACCQPHTTLEEARSVMKNRRIRHLPVLDGDSKLCGMISIGDLNAWQSNEHEQTIQVLTDYIYGRT
jgi:CBS domain-containing protein